MWQIKRRSFEQMLGHDGLNGRILIVLFVFLCPKNMNATSISLDPTQPKIQGDTGYVGKNITVTCSADVGKTGSLVIFTPYQKHMDFPPHIMGDMYLVKNTTTAERKITFFSLQKKHDKMMMGCYVKVPKFDFIDKMCDAKTRCLSRTIRVFYGPQPPQMDVTYDSPPSTSLMGGLLKATCTANVGEDILGGQLVWIMVTNDQNIYPQDYTEGEVGVTIHQKITPTTEGDVITSKLIIPKLTHRHDGLVLLCFSHLGVRHVLVGCPQGDELCVQSRPLHVKRVDILTFKTLAVRVVMFFTAVIMVVLAATVWSIVTKINSDTDDQAAEVVVAVNNGRARRRPAYAQPATAVPSAARPESGHPAASTRPESGHPAALASSESGHPAALARSESGHSATSTRPESGYPAASTGPE